MKKNILYYSLIWMIMLICSSCAHEKTIDGIVYQPYGLFDQSKKSDSIMYHISAGNICWSIIFSETIVVPTVFVGWYLFEPDRKKYNYEYYQ